MVITDSFFQSTNIQQQQFNKQPQKLFKSKTFYYFSLLINHRSVLWRCFGRLLVLIILFKFITDNTFSKMSYSSVLIAVILNCFSLNVSIFHHKCSFDDYLCWWLLITIDDFILTISFLSNALVWLYREKQPPQVFTEKHLCRSPLK